MSRIFISYSRRDQRYAVALKQWIAEKDPALRDEIFVDVDPDTGILPGVRWREALKRANNRCEAVICLLSKNWESSTECRTEFRTAENLNKLIFSARLEPEVGEDLTGEWQYFDLFGGENVIQVDAGTEAVSFNANGLHRLLRGIKQAGIGVTSFPWPPPGQLDRAPYRGWEPFESGDAGVFFGRDAELVLAMDALRGMRQSGKTLFVVMAASGAGKSSFLRAGIVPRLQNDDRNYLVLPTVRPELKALTGVSGLAQAICTTRQKFGLAEPPLGDIKDACTRGDVAAVRSWLTESRDAAAGRLLDTADGEPLMIVVPLDQAEELFTGDIPEATGLLTLINGLALDSDTEARLPLIVAATIRTDRYDRLQEALQGTDLQTEKFDLCAMDVTQFENVVTGPARRSTDSGRPLHLDEQLVQRLLADASGSADALPLLSLTLAWLYRDYGTTGRLTAAPYAERGGMGSVVQTEIDTLLSSDDEERGHQLELLRSAFIPWLARINPLGNEPMRRVAKWTNLPEAARPLINKFVAKRLLVKDERDREIVVEVALESLLRQWPELQTWLEQDRESLKAADDIERDAKRWEARERDPSRLIGGTWLAEAEALAAAPGYRDLLGPSLDFLVASRQMESAEQDREKLRQQKELEAAREKQATAEQHANDQRQSNRRLKALVAVAVVVTLFAVGAFINSHRAKLRARAEEHYTHAQAVLAGDVEGSDVQAFKELLSAYDTVPNDGHLVNALRRRVSTIRISDAREAVIGVAVSAQSHRLAVATADNHIRVWNTNTPRWREHPLDDAQTLTSPSTSPVGYRSIAISPDGSLIACGRADGDVELWHLDGNPTSRIMKSHHHQGVVSSVAFSEDGQRIASAGGADRVVTLSNTIDAETHSITTHSEVFAVAFDPRSALLASGGSDGDIKFWNPDGSPERTIPNAHPNGVMSLAFSPTRPVIASGGADNLVQLWSADSRNPLFDHPLKRHTEMVEGVAFNASGTRVVSTSADHTVQMWDADSGKPVGDPMLGHKEIVWAAAFVADDKEIVSGSNDHFIRVWDGAVGQPFSAPLQGHEGPITSIAINSGGNLIVSGSADRTVRLWDLHSGGPVDPPLAGHAGVVTSVAFSPIGDLIASGSADGTIRLWRTDSHDFVRKLEVGQPVYSVAFSPQGDRLAFAGGDCRVAMWDLASTQPTDLPCDGRGPVLAVAFNPRGDSVAAGGVDGKLRLWRADTRSLLWGKDIMDPLSSQIRTRFNLASGRPGIITSVSFSFDGTRIASGSSMWRDDENPGGVVQRWDTASGSSVGEPMHPPEGSVTAVAFSPPAEGKVVNQIVSGDSDYHVRLWDADSTSGEQMGGPLQGHQNGVVSVAFTPDAKCIVSGSVDGTIRIWPNPPTESPEDALRNKIS